MTDIVPVTEKSDFSGMGLTQSKTGHVHSPWWSYAWRDYQHGPPSTIGSYFHHIRSRSTAAFANALGIPEREVICTQRKNETGDFEWRLGTVHPCELPQRKLTQVERMLAIQKLIGESEKTNAGLPAIDI